VNTDLEEELRAAFHAASEAVLPHPDLASLARRGARRRRRAAVGATIAAALLAGASYLGATVPWQPDRSAPPRSVLTPRVIVRLSPGREVLGLAVSGPYLYLATDRSGARPYALSAYVRATGRLIGQVSVPAEPAALVAGPARTVWLTFIPNQAGGPCGTWLLTADLARRSAARLVCNYALLPTGARTALTVVGTNGHLGTVVMPPPGQPGRPRVTPFANLGRFAVTSLTPVGGHIAALLTNDFGDLHVVIAGNRRLSYGGGSEPLVQSVAAEANSLWAATFTSNGPSSGPLIQLSADLRPITPHRVDDNPVLRDSQQVWSHQATVWVATARAAHRLVCFADHGGIGRMATIPVPGQPIALAALNRTVYVAIGGMAGTPAGEVVGYSVPAGCR